MYNQSYFHIMEYQSDPFQLTDTYQSRTPWRENLFFEGAVEFHGSIYILTWREHVVLKLNRETFELESELRWERQGWGLTHN